MSDKEITKPRPSTSMFGNVAKATIADTSLPITKCLAKTYKNFTGEKKAGREVLNHCHIVGEVGRELLARLPNWLKAELFPEGAELIAAAHDTGKVSPTFQKKIYCGTDKYKKNPPPELKNFNPDIERQWGGHAGVFPTPVGVFLNRLNLH